MTGHSTKSSESENVNANTSNRDPDGTQTLENSMPEETSETKDNVDVFTNISKFVIICITTITTAVLLIYYLQDKAILLPTALVLAGGLAVLGLVISLIKFLEPNGNSITSSNGLIEAYFDLIKTLLAPKVNVEYQESLHKQKVINDIKLITDEEKQEIISSLQAGLENDLLNEANKRLLDKLASTSKQLKVGEFFKNSRDRIIAETASQSKRGSLNLSIGIATALIGVAFLVYIVLTSPEQTDIASFVVHFAPRASVVILIEVFAYFFLRLYKSSLDEIKYFQNELTNLESKYLAVLLLDEDKDSHVFSSTISSLISTERNFVLEKGQTTILLERDKIASNTENRVFSLLEKVLPKK